MSGVNSLSSIDEERPMEDAEKQRTHHRRRWKLRLRRRGGDKSEKKSILIEDKNVSPSESKPLNLIVVSATINVEPAPSAPERKGCGSIFSLRFLILFSVVIELIGCLTSLSVGLIYIRNAHSFYEVDADGDVEKEEEKSKKLEMIIFLGKYKTGIVGLLGTCVIGIVIAFLMAFGTIYKSWKCLRAALALLFSVSMIHLLLACIYLYDVPLIATVLVIPFRAFEFYLIIRFIRQCKNEKLEELKQKVKQAGGGNMTTTSRIAISQTLLMENASLCSFDKEDLQEVAGLKNAKSTERVDVDSQPYVAPKDKIESSNTEQPEELLGSGGSSNPDMIHVTPEPKLQKAATNSKYEERTTPRKKYRPFEYDMMK